MIRRLRFLIPVLAVGFVLLVLQGRESQAKAVAGEGPVAADAAESLNFKPASVTTQSTLPLILPAPTAGTGTPGVTAITPTVIPQQVPATLFYQPITVVQPQMYPPPVPNISQSTANSNLAGLAAFLSALSGGSKGGVLPGGSMVNIPNVSSSGVYSNPGLYYGPASTYGNADSVSAAAAAAQFPAGNYIPNCKAPTGGLVSALPVKTSTNLAGHVCTRNDTDRLTCMVCNLMFEAGTQGQQGQIEVARSVMSRVFSKAYPDTVCKVVYQGDGHVAQYSWTYEHWKDPHILPSGAKLQELIQNATEGMREGPDCMTNYYAYHIIGKPRWAQGGTCAQTLHAIQDHAFCDINGTPTRNVSQIAIAECKYEGQPASSCLPVATPVADSSSVQSAQ